MQQKTILSMPLQSWGLPMHLLHLHQIKYLYINIMLIMYMSGKIQAWRSTENSWTFIMKCDFHNCAATGIHVNLASLRTNFAMAMHTTNWVFLNFSSCTSLNQLFSHVMHKTFQCQCNMKNSRRPSISLLMHEWGHFIFWEDEFPGCHDGSRRAWFSVLASAAPDFLKIDERGPSFGVLLFWCVCQYENKVQDVIIWTFSVSDILWYPALTQRLTYMLQKEWKCWINKFKVFVLEESILQQLKAKIDDLHRILGFSQFYAKNLLQKQIRFWPCQAW